MGYILNKSSTTQVGIFVVPVTPRLRKKFMRIHRVESGALAPEEQFFTAEQEKLYAACVHVDELKQSDNLLELIHFLATQGVPVTEMLAKLRSSTGKSNYGDATPRKLAMRIMLAGLAPFEAQGSDMMDVDNSEEESSISPAVARELEEVMA